MEQYVVSLFLSSSCTTIKNQNNYAYKVDNAKKDEEKSKIDISKVSKIRNLVRNQRIENLKKPQKSNIVDYLDIHSNDNNEFYKNNYIVIKTFDEFKKIMYKNSTLDKIDKTTLLYQNVKKYKKDNQLHTFLKNEFENQFLNNISVEQILKNKNIFLISNFNKKNFKKGKIKTFGLGVKNENSNLEVIKILFFDKKINTLFLID